jgi:hypothetical protein
MDNRIRQINVWDSRLDPAEAEVWITVYPEQVTSTTQVRGRLVGPRCPYASTVEVAYHLREHSREYETTGDPKLVMRVIIPEACFWDVESPFLYQGPLELWQNGQRCDQVQVTHGLRVIQLGPRGLRVNGRPFTVRGIACERCSEEEALRLHRAGYNTLLAPVTAQTADLWDIGARFGFLMLGRITAKEQLSQTQSLTYHASFLGWLLDAGFLNAFPFDQEPSLVATVLPAYWSGDRPFVGVELSQPPVHGSLPPGTSFIACSEELVTALGAINELPGPKIILRKKSAGSGESEKMIAAPPGVLGWIDLTP